MQAGGPVWLRPSQGAPAVGAPAGLAVEVLSPPAGPEPRAGGSGRSRTILGVVALVVLAAVTGTVLFAGTATSAPSGELDAQLRARFDEAVADAAQDGITLILNSGWRSPKEQQRLVDDAVKRHGSAAEARRWVLPPETSAHVAGLAIDVGPARGALWLSERSERYGLCRTYANEAWHFEPVIEPGGTCPAMLEDSSAGWAGFS